MMKVIDNEFWGMYEVGFIPFETHVKAGEIIDSGFSNKFVTAPKEPGYYDLYQAYYIPYRNDQPYTGFAGWKWVKTK